MVYKEFYVFVIQFKKLKKVPLLSWEVAPERGKKYNPLLGSASVMEQAVHIHIEDFKVRGHLQNYIPRSSQEGLS